ncbi:2-oxoglutarate ferredoxin oxidoreductase subunit beta [Anaerolineae bacterium]|nr:2-oxoglutarate ferredoxin oxidoreductase subunit beta [Anaerolineae bacterium]
MATATVAPSKLNLIGLDKSDYKGNPSTLCAGCGHDSISAQIIQVAFELGLKPENVIKLSGIGCSSKSPAYFLNRSHGLNAVHGRMPSVASGAMLANRTLTAIGVSGDGDTGSIGLGQFKHIIRRNVPMVYVIENNGVYGLTKGQFSATSDEGQKLKYYGDNEYPAVDLCMEAIVSGCGFVARSFAGDPKQVRPLLKAAFSFNGTAVLDIISPCVTFNNNPDSNKSYEWVRDHDSPLHDISFVPVREEITVDYEPGETKAVTMHDGAKIVLKKLAGEHDPTDRMAAIMLLERSRTDNVLTTGLIYYNPDRDTVQDSEGMVATALALLPDEKLRPVRSTLEKIVASLC